MGKHKHFSFPSDLALRSRTPVIGLVFLVGCAGAQTPRAANTSSERSARGEHGEPGHGHHHRFDDAEKWSKVFDDPARDAWQKPARVVEVMTISAGMRVADVGAGTGYFEPWLARAVGAEGKVVGEDVEPKMVAWILARAKREGLTNVEALAGAPDDPKLGEKAFDRILIVDTWHHVDDRVAFAGRLSRALRPGGAVFIVDFTAEAAHGPPPPARLAPAAVVGELAAAGLDASVVTDAGLPDQYVVRGNVRP